MTAILPHVKRIDAHPNILAFPPRTSNAHEEEEEGGEEEEEESTDSESSMTAVRPTTATAKTLPCNPYGLVFLRAIRVGVKHPVPRFEKSDLLQFRALSEKAWRYFFGVAREEISNQLLRSSIIKKVNPRRIPNKVKRTALRLKGGEDQDPKLFDLTSKGYRLPDPVVDEGSDQGMDSNDNPGNHDSDDDLDSKLSTLWRQFLVDLTAKAPNPKGGGSPSYCKLNEEERLKVDDEVHRNRKLSDYWVDCQWKIATQQEWTLNFNRLLPDKGDTLYGNAQNYKSATYYLEWKALMSNSNALTVFAMREQIRRRFNSLFWLPHAQTDRIWHTKFLHGFTRSNNVDKSKPAPCVLINWTAVGTPSW